MKLPALAIAALFAGGIAWACIWVLQECEFFGQTAMALCIF